MGMPSYCFWENILDRYPNARVILTVRDEDQCKFDGNGLPTGRNAASCAAFFDDFFGGCD